MSEIRKEVVRHFYEVVSKPNIGIPHLNGVVFRCFYEDIKLVLTTPFSLYDF